MDGTVPIVVAAELLQRFFVNIGNDDVGIVVGLALQENAVFVAGGILNFCGPLEKLIVENIFCRFGCIIVLGTSKDKNENHGYCR